MAATGSAGLAGALVASVARRRPDVVAVVVLYNGAAWIERCLRSLAGEMAGPRVVVVDNASTDDGVRRVAVGFPQVTLLQMSGNLGFGAGCNAGIRHALETQADHVLLLNQDAWLAPGALGQLIACLEAEPAYGVASPLHCDAELRQLDRRTTAHYLLPNAMDYLSDATLGMPAAHYRIRGINAAAWLIRVDTLRRHGGFDPIFFMYCEDDDLLDRWQRHGVGFALVPAARVGHAREMAAPARDGWWPQMRRQALRLKSKRVLDLKRLISDGLPGTRTVLAAGVADALAECIVQRSLSALLSGLWATLGAARRASRVRKHARQCLQPGPHFLDLEPRA